MTMNFKTTLALATLAILVTACGKEPPPLMSLPPVKEQPKVSFQQTTPDQAQLNAGQEATGIKRAQDHFLVSGDYDRSGAVGKSGKQCTTTCFEQSTVEACKAAVIADGCNEPRDDWRTKNPDKRTYESGGRFQMRQSRPM